MTYRTVILFGIIVSSLSGCAPKVKTKLLGNSYPVLPYSEKVILVTPKNSLPSTAQYLGDLKVKDAGFTTDCEYDRMIQEAKFAARKVGSNVLKVTKVMPPDAQSTCYRIKAELYRLQEADKESLIASLSMGSHVPQDSSRIVVYRPGNYGALVNYKFRIDDEDFFKVTPNSINAICVPAKESAVIWAMTEAREEVPTELVGGTTYYVRCGLRMGVFVGTPKIEIVSEERGRIELDLMAQ